MILKIGTLGGMVVDGVCESVKNGHGVLGLGLGSGPCMGFGFLVCDWGKLIVEQWYWCLFPSLCFSWPAMAASAW